MIFHPPWLRKEGEKFRQKTSRVGSKFLKKKSHQYRAIVRQSHIIPKSKGKNMDQCLGN
jgi:hypothetical protein